MSTESGDMPPLMMVKDALKATAPVSFAMQPVLMWVPYWGFVPVMAMGIAGYGV